MNQILGYIDEELRQGEFVFLTQYGQGADGMDVGIQASYRAGQYQISVNRGNCSCHAFSLHLGADILALGNLEC